MLAWSGCPGRLVTRQTVAGAAGGTTQAGCPDQLGGMFWLWWNTLSGSHSRFTATNRSQPSP